jgi:hypothetical protein
MSNTETQLTGISKAPTHIAWNVTEGCDKEGNSKNYWSRIGAAWAHKDGKGFNIQLDAYPISGKISLREISERETSEAE